MKGMILDVYMKIRTTMNNFDRLITSDKPTLVDFSAEWCGPCKMMPPILADLKKKTGDRVVIIKMDIDKNPAYAQQYNVQYCLNCKILK